jgi:hypothetical protein
MPDFQYVFSCKHCDRPIRLLAQTLGHVFQSPALRSIDAGSIAAVCSQCKHVANYSLHKTSPDYRRLDTPELSAPTRETVHLGQLRCAEESCKTPLQLYVAWSATTTAEERSADIKTWLWDGLHCPERHAVSPPRNWIDDPPL